MIFCILEYEKLENYEKRDMTKYRHYVNYTRTGTRLSAKRTLKAIGNPDSYRRFEVCGFQFPILMFSKFGFSPVN